MPGKNAIKIEGPGYNEKFDVHYDKKYELGDTKVYVIAPNISREESDRRWKEVCEVASKVARQMMDRGIDLKEDEHVVKTS